MQAEAGTVAQRGPARACMLSRSIWSPTRVTQRAGRRAEDLLKIAIFGGLPEFPAKFPPFRWKSESSARNSKESRWKSAEVLEPSARAGMFANHHPSLTNRFCAGTSETFSIV